MFVTGRSRRATSLLPCNELAWRRLGRKLLRSKAVILGYLDDKPVRGQENVFRVVAVALRQSGPLRRGTELFVTPLVGRADAAIPAAKYHGKLALAE